MHDLILTFLPFLIKSQILIKYQSCNFVICETFTQSMLELYREGLNINLYYVYTAVPYLPNKSLQNGTYKTSQCCTVTTLQVTVVLYLPHNSLLYHTYQTSRCCTVSNRQVTDAQYLQDKHCYTVPTRQVTAAMYLPGKSLLQCTYQTSHCCTIPA